MLKKILLFIFLFSVLGMQIGFSGDKQIVTMTTSLGIIEVELFEKKSPIGVANFLNYVDSGFYKGVIFHRVIPGFMAQGGGFDANMRKRDTNAPIKNEAANRVGNKRGTLSYARTGVVDSATSQFFINLKDNTFLDYKGAASYGYAVFGKVIRGMDVVDAMARVNTGRRGGHQNVPVTPIVILEAKRK